ncbi:MAG: DedA family protein [Proteobacteria bacterium]|nr:DedA family protein [Pseudomonadota bacterium]
MIEGYIGLFLAAFLAATVVPFSSEVLLLGMDLSGEFEAIGLLAVASLGNTLGSVTNWCLGRFCLHWQDAKWFPVKPRALDRAGRWFNRYGTWVLLLAWVPVIGDPITLAAGALKTRFSRFLLLVAISKTGRYAVLLGGADWLTS